MKGAEHDPVVRGAIDELRQSPRNDPAAIARIVAAAAAARVAPSDEDVIVVERSDGSAARRWTLAGVAAAAAVAGFALSNARRPLPEVVPASTVAELSGPASVDLQTVANTSAEVLPIMKQFVFNSRTARRVSVVGDFNQWNSSVDPMTRSPDGDLWSITVPVLPGRHMYAFMVDDSTFVLDPREATARDTDLGVEASVTIVGKP